MTPDDINPTFALVLSAVLFIVWRRMVVRDRRRS